MIINLPWVNPIDTNKIPANFDELVKESFEKFTEGTSESYTFEDKLMYLDNLRESYLRRENSYTSVKNLIRDRVTYELEEYGTLPSEDEVLNIDFMEECYNAGFRPLRDKWDSCSKSRNDEIHKLILRIIKIVVEY